MRPELVIPSLKAHTATVIFLHGLGDSGHGWSAVAKMLQPALPHVKWILPHAPARPITINYGEEMPGWYDIRSLSETERVEDEPGMMDSLSKVSELIKNEEAHVPLSRIVLGGFSQGAAMTLLHATTAERTCAGYVALSGYLPLRNRLNEIGIKGRSVPVFQAHGEDDIVVRFAWGKASNSALTSSTSGLGFTNVTFKSYPDMGHSGDVQEFHDLTAWLQTVIP
ncbi:Phospholipase/carboxylesterase [Cladochytrium replicatum]|nr:Phospholipase/carboxylesterase [Cladochytrium replicatum]